MRTLPCGGAWTARPSPWPRSSPEVRRRSSTSTRTASGTTCAIRAPGTPLLHPRAQTTTHSIQPTRCVTCWAARITRRERCGWAPPTALASPSSLSCLADQRLQVSEELLRIEAHAEVLDAQDPVLIHQ